MFPLTTSRIQPARTANKVFPVSRRGGHRSLPGIHSSSTSGPHVTPMLPRYTVKPAMAGEPEEIE